MDSLHIPGFADTADSGNCTKLGSNTASIIRGIQSAKLELVELSTTNLSTTHKDALRQLLKFKQYLSIGELCVELEEI